ncbi:MAG: hypothetical protein ACNA8L_05475 [Luteolibacter sp.]|jgi:hypothetical protein
MIFRGFARHLALIAGAFLCVAGASIAENDGFDAVDGPNVRVTRHEDGGRTVFTRSPDQRTLTKRTFGASRNLTMITVYRMDENGNPLSCRIYDGQRQELYKASYGYHRENGRLIEERMFDARVKRIDPATGREMPVRRFIYTYDEQGNRNHPIAINLLEGKKAEEVFRLAPSALEVNPFDDEMRAPANPNARPLGGNR